MGLVRPITSLIVACCPGWLRLGRNVELENFTAAIYEAREIAIERMQVEAAAAKAEGVVGVEIHEGSHVWKSHVIEFFAIGTAVPPSIRRKSRRRRSVIPLWCCRSMIKPTSGCRP